MARCCCVWRRKTLQPAKVIDMYETLSIKIDSQGIADVCLNIPEKRNALSASMISELTHLALDLGAQTAIRAIVLSGAGKLFCAGGDLAWMHAQIGADRATRMQEARKLAVMLQTLNEMPTPLIARIHGGAYGGGVGLACVADVVLAEKGTVFAFTETRLGLTPATIAPYVIARMGEGNARRVFMSSRVFDADEAQALGIVSCVVPPGEMNDAVRRETAPYLSVAPGAVGAAKALARSLGPVIDDGVIDATVERLADSWEGEEAALGIAAFLNRTAAPWAN